MSALEEMTLERREALLGAAVSAIAWELVEYETDTADRGVSEAHYRNAVDHAKTLLPTLLGRYTSEGTVEVEVGVNGYTPTTDEIREYVETGGEPRPWVEIDGAEKMREEARTKAFDRWLAAHDAEVTRPDQTLLAQVRAEADELRRQGYPAGVLLRLLANVAPLSEEI